MLDSSFDLARSLSLHDRVRRFIDASLSGVSRTECFDRLALDIAYHQFDSATGVERLFASRAIRPESLQHASEIPAVPTDAFKLRRIACHPTELDEVVFLTSGTTLGARGKHALRDAGTYRHAARTWGRHMLYPDVDKLHWVLLAPQYENNPSSSLGFMLNDFSHHAGASAAWVIRGERLQLDVLRDAIEQASTDGSPVIVAGASFAFVHLLDEVGMVRLPLGTKGRVMQTGGFKGKSREVDPVTLRDRLSQLFEIPSEFVVAEYGMTELGSQAYEGSLRRALGLAEADEQRVGTTERRDVFLPPPWMRVRAVDPETLEELGDERVGLARIEDLTNVDSAVAIQTADQIRTYRGTFHLLGRTPGASPRGCSIGIDEILAKEAKEKGEMP